MRLYSEVDPQADGEQDARPTRRRKRRRGATSMEYCVMASFILLVVIAAVQSFGVHVGALFTSNAAATSQISSGQNGGP